MSNNFREKNAHSNTAESTGQTEVHCDRFECVLSHSLHKIRYTLTLEDTFQMTYRFL